MKDQEVKNLPTAQPINNQLENKGDILAQYKTLILSIAYSQKMPNELKKKVNLQIKYYFDHYAPEIWCPYEQILEMQIAKESCQEMDEYKTLVDKYIKQAV